MLEQSLFKSSFHQNGCDTKATQFCTDNILPEIEYQSSFFDQQNNISRLPGNTGTISEYLETGKVSKMGEIIMNLSQIDFDIESISPLWFPY